MKRNFDIDKVDPTLTVGDYVAYYVGDRSKTSRKLRRRFTGPWKITNKLNHNTYQITNEQTNETMACHAQMLKKYHKQDFTPLAAYEQTQLNKRKLRKQTEQQRKNNILVDRGTINPKDLTNKITITRKQSQSE